MPMVAAAVVGTVVASATTTAVGGALASYAVTGGVATLATAAISGAVASGVGMLAGGLASTLVSGALSPKKGSGTGQGISPQSRSEVVRQTIALREYVYGRQKKAGSLVYHYTSGDNKYYYMAIVVASHSIQEIEKVFVNEVAVTLAVHTSTDTQYSTTGITHYKVDRGQFKDKVWIDIGLGSTGNQANKRFVDECSDTFSSTDTAEGVAVIYVKLKHDPEVFSNIPNIQVQMKGKNDITDTRTATTGYTDNAALCVNDYIKDDIAGLNMGASRIVTSTVDAAANVCEEVVSINDRYTEPVILDVEGSSKLSPDGINDRHDAVSVIEGPGSGRWLSATGTDEYIQFRYSSGVDITKILVHAPGEVSGTEAPTSLALKASNTGSFSGEEVTVLNKTGVTWDAGQEREYEFSNGTSYTYYRLVMSNTTVPNIALQSLRMFANETSELRYTTNGTITTSARPSDVLEGMLMAMAGAISYTNGMLRLVVGEYQTPSVTIGEDQMLAPVSLARSGRRDKYNAVRGVYIKELNQWKQSDFPHVTNSTYETEDGERTYKDLDMPFTITESAAQRIAKIQLERNRQDIVVNIVVSIDMWDIAAGDTVMLTYASWGFSSKVFDVLERNTVFMDVGAEGQLIALSLTLRETASSVYSWNLEETTADLAPNTNLANATIIDPPQNLVLSSTEDHLIRGTNGRVVTRIKVSWDSISNVFVAEGGAVEMQYKLSSSSTWESVKAVDGAQTFGYIVDVDDRETYDVRVRSRSTAGVVGDWNTVSNHVVIGKSTPPPRVTGFTASDITSSVAFKWNTLDVLDVYGYEIRYGPEGVQWKDATPIVSAKQGNSETSGQVPPGTWSFLIKAFDNYNYSNIASVAGPLEISNANSVLSAVADGEFPGTLDNFVKHYTEVLAPDDQNLASSYSNFEVFDNYVPTPELICKYTSDEVDLGSDQNVRIWGEIISELGPGVTSGVADPKLQVSYRSSTDSSSGAEITTPLVLDSGTYTNCVLHYDGSIVPDSQSLASATTNYEVFDNYVNNVYETCTYEAPEIDLGADGNVNIDLVLGANTGPGETGVAETTVSIDTRTSSGSYDGFEAFSSGTYNLRYYKAKVDWNNSSNVAYVESFNAELSSWRDWIIGNVSGIRYVQARIVEDTTIGVAKVTDFNWTIDQ